MSLHLCMCVCVCVCVWREHVGTHSSVNIMLPSDIAELFRSEGLHPRRMTLQPWATHRETRQLSKGVFLKWVRPVYNSCCGDIMWIWLSCHCVGTHLPCWGQNSSPHYVSHYIFRLVGCMGKAMHVVVMIQVRMSWDVRKSPEKDCMSVIQCNVPLSEGNKFCVCVCISACNHLCHHHHLAHFWGHSISCGKYSAIILSV